MEKKPTFNKTVFICSPFRPAAEDPEAKAREARRNIALARIGCQIAKSAGCTPLAPHLFFPQFLDDETPEERKIGIEMGLRWLEFCDELWVLGSRITDWMAREIAHARRHSIPVKIIRQAESPEERLLRAIFGGCYRKQGEEE